MTTLSRKIVAMLWEGLDIGQAVIIAEVVDPEDGKYARHIYPIEGSVACH